MSTLLSLSIATIAGVLLARLFKPLNLPSVTAYLIAGVLVGPFFLGKAGVDGLGFVSMEYIENLSLFSDVALGFIAFSSGNEVKLESLKKIGKQAFYGDKKLKTITIKTTMLTSKNVGSSAFKGIYAKATIKVPKSKLTSYKKILKAKGVSSKANITK